MQARPWKLCSGEEEDREKPHPNAAATKKSIEINGLLVGEWSVKRFGTLDLASTNPPLQGKRYECPHAARALAECFLMLGSVMRLGLRVRRQVLYPLIGQLPLEPSGREQQLVNLNTHGQALNVVYRDIPCLSFDVRNESTV